MANNSSPSKVAADYLIKFSAAELGYPGTPILRQVDLSIEAGEFVSVVGGNGEGKSTLLRTLLGVLRPLSGGYQRRPELKVGYVPQQMQIDGIYPLSTRELISMGNWRGPKPPGRLSVSQVERVNARLHQVGLDAQSDLLFHRLSGGQKQRALLARALVQDVDLLLLDEPTAGVDRAAQAVIHRILEELHQAGTAIVLVTHEPEKLAAITGRWLQLVEGRIRCQVGEPPFAAHHREGR